MHVVQERDQRAPARHQLAIVGHDPRSDADHPGARTLCQQRLHVVGARPPRIAREEDDVRCVEGAQRSVDVGDRRPFIEHDALDLGYGHGNRPRDSCAGGVTRHGGHVRRRAECSEVGACGAGDGPCDARLLVDVERDRSWERSPVVEDLRDVHDAPRRTGRAQRELAVRARFVRAVQPADLDDERPAHCDEMVEVVVPEKSLRRQIGLAVGLDHLAGGVDHLLVAVHEVGVGMLIDRSGHDLERIDVHAVVVIAEHEPVAAGRGDCVVGRRCDAAVLAAPNRAEARVVASEPLGELDAVGIARRVVDDDALPVRMGLAGDRPKLLVEELDRAVPEWEQERERARRGRRHSGHGSAGYRARIAAVASSAARLVSETIEPARTRYLPRISRRSTACPPPAASRSHRSQSSQP